VPGVTGLSGASATQYLSFSSDEVNILAVGTPSELAGISVTKSNNSCSITWSTGTPKLLYASVYFTSAQHSGNNLTFAVKEPLGASSIAKAIKPSPIRYNLDATLAYMVAPSVTIASNTFGLIGGNVQFQMSAVTGTHHVVQLVW
jgi:hypothetical protein